MHDPLFIRGLGIMSWCVNHWGELALGILLIVIIVVAVLLWKEGTE